MTRPNIIFILVDDLGWAEPSCYGNLFNETPHIDSLAESGVRFTDAYASSVVCSPSRAGLLTGQAPPRNGITDYLRPWSDWYLPLSSKAHPPADTELPEDTEFRMDPQHFTMAQMFKECGYTTGIIGKWHLSGYNKDGVKYGPSQYGFDEVLISEQTGIGSGSYFHPYTKVDPTIKPKLGENEYLVDRMNYEALEFIKRHKEEPFFLYLSHYAVHTTLDAKDEDIEYFSQKRKKVTEDANSEGEEKVPKTKKTRKYLKFLIKLMDLINPFKLGDFKKNKQKWLDKNNPVLAAMLKSIDEGVGKIVSTLKEMGLYENTMIVFTSDNGGDPWVTQNGHLSAGKSFTYEGGLRVPLIITYPKHITSNITLKGPTTNLDFYPTFADLIGYEIPRSTTIDGISLLPALTGKGGQGTTHFAERYLSWHYPRKRRHFLGGRSSAAQRRENYKYVWFFNEEKGELFDLAHDESEKNNLANELSEKAEKHRKDLRVWLKDVGGTIPKGQKGP
ncbi:MAG: sulfatase [Promethearchaeia archaeon]